MIKVIRTSSIFFMLFLLIVLFTACSQRPGDSLQSAENKDLTLQTQTKSYPGPFEKKLLYSSVKARSLLYESDPTVSYCESTEGLKNKYSGVRDLKVYPLASLSKIFLTAWALDVLTPDYRFKMIWKIKKIKSDENTKDNNKNTYDAYLQTNWDPILNIEKLLFAVSQLNAQGIFQIRNLYIDKSTRIYLSVLDSPHFEFSETPISLEKSAENLKLILNSVNWGPQTEKAKVNLKRLLIFKDSTDLSISSLKFSVQNIIIKDEMTQSQTDEIYGINKKNINSSDLKIEIQSASVLKYLKNINVYSNNYVSDSLFEFLGGKIGFKKFQTENLKISEAHLQFYSGSGLPIEGNGQRLDNTGTCLSVLKALHFIHQKSAQYHLNLGHVLLTAGTDDGTFDSQIQFDHDVILKTGRLYEIPTLNIAGIASSSEGLTYFAMLGHDFNNSDEYQMKLKRDYLISDLLSSLESRRNSFLTLVMDSIFFKFLN